MLELLAVVQVSRYSTSPHEGFWHLLEMRCKDNSLPAPAGGPSTQQPKTSRQSSLKPGWAVVKLLAICLSKLPKAGACWLAGTGTISVLSPFPLEYCPEPLPGGCPLLLALI